MQQFADLMVEIWREACKNLELGLFLETIIPPLRAKLPFDRIILRRIDLQHHAVVTTQAGIKRASTTVDHGFSLQQIEPWIRWCRRGRILRQSADELKRSIPHLLPDDTIGNALVAPLGTSDEPTGILIIVRNGDIEFDQAHENLARMLQEPFSVTLSNEHNLRELKSLREAAEAERRSLLHRLGREDLSDTIVGSESGLRQVMERVELVASSHVPVLILGETGSGKEVVARAIHQRSDRRNGPFLRVNCGAIPPELLDSELFGHEKGSFTGAVNMRQGWFEQADGGTLFLDECGELPLAAQVRLLRILQDGTFQRVGGERPLAVDVRIVAATHRDLKAFVGDGRFREDLWYRIAVFPIRLPSLRERQEDIPELATHFAKRASIRLGFASLVPNEEDLEILRQYPWPGNVRELSAVIERAAILGNGRTLEVAKSLGIGSLVQSSHFSEVSPTARPQPAPNIGSPDARSLALAPQISAVEAGRFPTLDEAMSQHIEAALARTRGRIEGPDGAAELLGINPHTLRARMRKLGVKWQEFRPSRATRSPFPTTTATSDVTQTAPSI